MDTATALESAQTLLSPLVERFTTPETSRMDAYLPVDKIVEATQTMTNAGGWHLSAITGMDVPPTDTTEGATELLYHFCKGSAVMTLRIQAPYSQPDVPSICPVISAATFYEREIIEMLGVNFPDTPDKGKLLLPDDWPDGVYPLRKSFKGLS